MHNLSFNNNKLTDWLIDMCIFVRYLNANILPLPYLKMTLFRQQWLLTIAEVLLMSDGIRSTAVSFCWHAKWAVNWTGLRRTQKTHSEPQLWNCGECIFHLSQNIISYALSTIHVHCRDVMHHDSSKILVLYKSFTYLLTYLMNICSVGATNVGACSIHIWGPISCLFHFPLPMPFCRCPCKILLDKI